MASILSIRAGQRRFMHLVDQWRLVAFLARRQYGKTTTFAKIALRKMMKTRDHTVIFGSAKISLSREIVRKEANILQSAISEAVAQAADGALRVIDSDTHKEPDVLTPDDFAELFEAQRLEFRFYHTSASYSRTKVVALRADTVGETGDLMCDEIGRVQNWRETWEAVSPIIAANPDFRCTLSTTVPPDDSHYSFDMLVPPVGMEFKPNPEGNVYESDMGIMVLRVDADDAYADGIPLYNMKTGEPETPAQNRAAESDKNSWDRNYGLKFLVGGASACGLIQLTTAQERGIGQCACIDIQSDADMDRAVAFLLEHLGPGPVGLGHDLATTEKATSNPTALAVTEQVGIDLVTRLVLTWKTRDPDIAEERVKRIVQAIPRRVSGGKGRKLCVDATNERYFASTLQRKLRAEIPVELVIGSEGIDRPGFEPMNMKQYTGSLLVGELNDNHCTLPPERYLKEDFRLVKTERGAFVCTPDAQGRHGDTFDATKLSYYALKGSSGPFAYEVVDQAQTEEFAEEAEPVGVLL